MEVSRKWGWTVFGARVPSGKRLPLYWIRGSMTVTTWTEEADAMSNKATSLKGQRGRSIARLKKFFVVSKPTKVAKVPSWNKESQSSKKDSWTTGCGLASCAQQVWLMKHFTDAHRSILWHLWWQRKIKQKAAGHMSGLAVVIMSTCHYLRTLQHVARAGWAPGRWLCYWVSSCL